LVQEATVMDKVKAQWQQLVERVRKLFKR